MEPPPQLLTMASPFGVPTHTAVDSDGVYPTIQASLFRPVSPSWVVPVFDATGGPPGQRVTARIRGDRHHGLRDVVGDRESIRDSPGEEGRSSSTSPSAVSTRCTKNGSWKVPDAASVA